MAAFALQPSLAPNNPERAANALLGLYGREGAGDLIEALLARMDALDGDSDREGVNGDGLTDDDEPDDVDCCAAGDDNVPDGPSMRDYRDAGPGDLDDAEYSLEGTVA